MLCAAYARSLGVDGWSTRAKVESIAARGSSSSSASDGLGGGVRACGRTGGHTQDSSKILQSLVNLASSLVQAVAFTSRFGRKTRGKSALLVESSFLA